MVRVLKGKAIIKSIDDRNYQLAIDDVSYHYNIELIAIDKVRVVAKLLADGIMLSRIELINLGDISHLYQSLRALYLYQGSPDAKLHIKDVMCWTRKIFGIDL